MSNTVGNTGKLYFQKAAAVEPSPAPPAGQEADQDPVISRETFVDGDAVPGVPSDRGVAEAIFNAYDKDGNGLDEAEFMRYYEEIGRAGEMGSLVRAELAYASAKEELDRLNREIAAAASQIDPTASDEERRAFIAWYQRHSGYAQAEQRLLAAGQLLEHELLQAQPILEEVLLHPDDPLRSMVQMNQALIVDALAHVSEAGKPEIAIDMAKKLLSAPMVEQLLPHTADMVFKQILVPAVQAYVAMKATEEGGLETALPEAESLLERVLATYGEDGKASDAYNAIRGFADSLKQIGAELAQIAPGHTEAALAAVARLKASFKGLGSVGSALTVLGITLAGVKLKESLQDGAFVQALVDSTALAQDVATFAARVARMVGSSGAAEAISKTLPLIALVGGGISLAKNLHDGELLAAMGDALVMASPVLGPWSGALGIGLKVVDALWSDEEPQYLQEAREAYQRYMLEQGASPEAAAIFAGADRESAERLMANTGLSAKQLKTLTSEGLDLLDPRYTDAYGSILVKLFARPELNGAVDSQAAYAFLSRVAAEVKAGALPPDGLYGAFYGLEIVMEEADRVRWNREGGMLTAYVRSAAEWSEAMAERREFTLVEDPGALRLMEILIAMGE